MASDVSPDLTAVGLEIKLPALRAFVYAPSGLLFLFDNRPHALLLVLLFIDVNGLNHSLLFFRPEN